MSCSRRPSLPTNATKPALERAPYDAQSEKEAEAKKRFVENTQRTTAFAALLAKDFEARLAGRHTLDAADGAPAVSVVCTGGRNRRELGLEPGKPPPFETRSWEDLLRTAQRVHGA